jgi:hypothetical protein
MAVGGDIIELSYNHPTVGSGILLPKANESSTFDKGGFRSDDDANGIDGGGNAIRKMNRVRWSAEMLVSHDSNVKKEYDKVVSMSQSPLPATWTITHVNGSIYSGEGFPVGDLKFNGNDATFSIKVAGSNLLIQTA